MAREKCRFSSSVVSTSLIYWNNGNGFTASEEQGTSEIARDRECQPSTNQFHCITLATQAIYQPHLPDGRYHPAYIAHSTRTHSTKTHITLQLMRRWTFDLNIDPTHGQPASYWARPVHVDEGLYVITWIRCLGGERLPTASYALRPNMNKLFFSASEEGSRLSSVFYTPADDTPSISILNKPAVNAFRVGQSQ